MILNLRIIPFNEHFKREFVMNCEYMKKVLFALSYLVCGIAIGLSLNASAQESIIPNWIKSTD